MNRLTLTARRLFLSYVLCSFGDPIFNVFISVYLWRQTQDPLLISVYNLFLFLVLPVGFFVSMKLSFIPLWVRYAMGSILQVLTVALLFHVQTFHFITVALFGSLFGTSAGVYWFARNILTWRLVRHKDRLFFASREWLVSVFMSFAIPLTLGWAIAIGTKNLLFTAQQAYEAVSLALIVIFSLAAFLIIGVRYFKKGLHKTQFKLQALWVRHRFLMFYWGLTQGIAVLVPLFAIFKFVGLEGAVGTIVSIASLISGVIITILGNRAKDKNEIQIIRLHILLSISAYLLFSLLYSTLGVVSFYIINALAGGFAIVLTAITNDTLDRVVGKHIAVSYVLDQEIFLNSGRVVSILIFILIYTCGPSDSLRIIMLLPVISQILLYFVSSRQLFALK